MHEVVLKSYDDAYSPPEEPMLRLAVVGDVLFLSIGTRKESPEDVHWHENDGIGVHLDEAADAIWMLLRSDQRAALRHASRTSPTHDPEDRKVKDA